MKRMFYALMAFAGVLFFTGCPNTSDTPVPITHEVNFSVTGGANGMLKAQVDGEAIKSGDIIQEGKTVTFTAKPNDGYTVGSWKGITPPPPWGEISVSVKISKAVNVSVAFVQNSSPEKSYTVHFSVNGANGTLKAQVDGNEIQDGDKIKENKIITFTATPKAGYKPVWNGDAASNGIALSFSKKVTKEVSVGVSFVSESSYSITYHLDGGSNHAANPASYNAASLPITLQAATKQGYTFAGWYDNAGFSGSKITTIAKASTGNNECWAKWTANTVSGTVYKVEHYQADLNGNYPTSPTETENKTGITNAQTIAAAKSYAGFEAQTVTQATIKGDGSTVVKIYYNRKDITLSLVLGADATGTKSITGKFGASVPVPADIKKAGYTFTGWTPALPATFPAEDASYTAQWKKIKYAVTVTLSGQQSNEKVMASASESASGETITLTAGLNTGRKITLSANGVAFTPSVISTDGGTAIFTMPAKAVTVNAAFSTKTCPVNFSVKGSNGTLTAKVDGKAISNGSEVAYGKTVTFTANPDTGYKVVWSDDAASNGTKFSFSIKVTKAVRVGVSFVPESFYSITYHLDGGTNNAANPASYKAAALPITLQAATKQGYSFAGWYEKSDFSGSKITQIAKGSTGDKAYWAKWTANSNTAYKVEHYQADLSGNYPTSPTETENKTGTTDAQTAAAAKSYPGFEAQTVTQETIKSDGSTVVKIYYNRKDITLSLVLGTGAAGTESITGKYGASVTVPADIQKTGYTLSGWTPAIPATFPAEDASYTAQWEKIKYTITVTVSGQQSNETVTASVSESASGETVTLTAALNSGRQVELINANGVAFTPAVIDTDGGTATFTMPAKAVTVNAAFSTKTYPVNFSVNGSNGTLTATVAGSAITSGAEIEYGKTITFTAHANTGYKVGSWNGLTAAAGSTTATLKVTSAVNINIAFVLKGDYSITYHLNGGTNHPLNPASYSKNDPTFFLKSPSRAGYKFEKWYRNANLSGMPADRITKGSTGDREFWAKWKARNDTPYTVEHYQADLNGAYPATPTQTENMTGTSGEESHANPIAYNGFKAQPITQEIIKGDGSTVVKIYYKRKTITINLDLGTDATGTTSVSGKYGAPVSLPTDIQRQGFTLSGWSPATPVKFFTYRTYRAKWTPSNNTPYTVVHRRQDLNGDYPQSLWETETKYGTTWQDTAAEAKSYVGFKADSFSQYKIKADGSTVVRIYYDRKKITLTLNLGAGAAGTESIKGKYGASVSVPTDIQKAGYTLNGWTPALPATFPAENASFTAQWGVSGNTAYTVEHYQADLNGAYPPTPTETENKTGATNTQTAVAAKNYTGFEAQPITQKTIKGDGSTVVKIYYNRKTITLSLVLGTGAAGTESITGKYGASVSVPTDIQKTGYHLIDWTPAIPATFPAENASYTAQWRKDYSITYHLNGGTSNAAAPVSYKPTTPTFFLPGATKQGYYLIGWYDNAGFSGSKVRRIYQGSTGDKEFWAKWGANVHTPYTVEHYQEDVSGAYPATPTETENSVGTTNTQTNARAKIYTGFEPQTVTQQTIKGDGSTVVKIYYNRKTFTLPLHLGTGATGSTSITGKFGTPVSVPTDIKKDGYTLSGWNPALPATFPAYNQHTYYAQWSKIKYTLTLNISGNIGTESVSTSQTEFTENEWCSLIVNANNGRKVTFTTPDGVTITPSVIKTTHGIASFQMPAKDITINAAFSDIDYHVNVNVSGNEGSEKIELDRVDGNYHYNDQVTLTATLNPDRCIKISNSNGVPVTPSVINTNGGTATFSMPKNDLDLNIQFRDAKSTLTFSSFGENVYAFEVKVDGIRVHSGDKIEVGKKVDLELFGTFGNTLISKWEKDGKVVATAEDSYTFTMEEPCNIKAGFFPGAVLTQSSSGFHLRVKAKNGVSVFGAANTSHLDANTEINNVFPLWITPSIQGGNKIVLFGEIEQIECKGKDLTAVNLRGCFDLKKAIFYNTSLTSLDLQDLKKLEEVSSNKSLITTLDLDGCEALKELYCRNAKLTSEIMSYSFEDVRSLEKLSFEGNEITNFPFDFSKFHALKFVSVINNKLNVNALKKMLHDLRGTTDGTILVYADNAEEQNYKDHWEKTDPATPQELKEAIEYVVLRGWKVKYWGSDEAHHTIEY